MVTMSEDRREQMLDRAQAANAFIIEDDYEVGLLGHVKPRPAIKSRDKNGTVIYVGSLSKTLSPSIRIGFIVARRDIIEAAKIVRKPHRPTSAQHRAGNNGDVLGARLSRCSFEQAQGNLFATLAHHAARH